MQQMPRGFNKKPAQIVRERANYDELKKQKNLEKSSNNSLKEKIDALNKLRRGIKW